MSALTMFEEAAHTHLVPYLGEVVDTQVKAFQLYQLKNTCILYDSIGCLAWSIGKELDKPAYVQALLVPLMHKFDNVPDSDITCLALFECLTSVVRILGKSISQVVPRFIMRCIRIINDTSQAAII